MSYITASEVSKILKISKRTLFRWEEQGKIRSERDGILKTRVYDKDYIAIVQKIIELNEQEKAHLSKLPKIREMIKENMLEQDYVPGKKLKLMNEQDVEVSMKAFKAEEDWMDEHKRLLDELFSFPRDIVREVLSVE